jgi:N4-gp56 family major capsid protein
MAVDQFRPEQWSAEILTALRNSLVYCADGIVNRDYEGEIQRAGDTVHITSIGEVATRAYTEHTTISWDELSDTQQDLLIDQKEYFAFKVDDVERAQALPGFVEEASTSAAYGLRDNADESMSAAMYAAVNNTANDLGAFTADISDQTAYNLFVEFRTTLNRDNVPSDGRWVIVPPELTGALLKDPRFINASASGSTEPLRNGRVGRIAGFDVFESNQTPDPTASTFAVIAGHPIAATYAEQILETEAMRLEDIFGDGVRGLHVFGRKVVRPEALAMASVVVQA